LATALHELIPVEGVVLDLVGETKDEVLEELVSKLALTDEAHLAVRRVLDLREAQGSTGVGHGIAIPHARCDEMESLRMAYGRKPAGIDWDAGDGQLVGHVFLILAPPIHVSNQYLQIMGDVAGLVRDAAVRDRLDAVEDPGEFMALLRRGAA
jgi:mannitol/fructose-specific phosphotransferase system IIA component (Ntr-type)